jgi:hypothetical protein|tara:strand:- start:1587 stop:2516 length:930 start_codon:yes stop_codon:yes gene_type:complete
MALPAVPVAIGTLLKWGIPIAIGLALAAGGEGSDDDLTSEQKAQLTNAGVLDASGRIVPGMINTEDFTGAPMSDPRNPTVGRRFGDRELFESRNKSPAHLLGAATRGDLYGPEYVRQGDIYAEYKALSDEDKERLALALFLGDEDAPNGFMSHLLIESIDDIYRPANVAAAMQLAIDQAALAWEKGTVEEEELIPTVTERFAGFTDEDVNRAAEKILARNADKFTSKAELEAKFKTAYGQATGRTPSQNVIEAFIKGIHSREEAGETVDPYEMAALATETAGKMAPELVNFQKGLSAVSKIDQLSSRLA